VGGDVRLFTLLCKFLPPVTVIFTSICVYFYVDELWEYARLMSYVA
jgi:hypothetical protein